MNTIISERGNFCARIIQDEYAENPRDVYYHMGRKEAAAALASLEASLAAQPAQLTLPGLPTNQRGHVLPYGGSHAAA